MEIKFSNSSERFDNIHFSNEIIDGQSFPLFTTYTCPICKEKIDFTKKNFEERTLKKFSNLSIEHQKTFDKYAKDKIFNNLEFLDWYCPQCKLPVRVYAQHWAGGNHGDGGVNIINVLELF